MQNLDVELNKETSNTRPEANENVETDWPQSNSIDLYALASAAGRLAGNLNTKPGALEDFFNKLKILEYEWYESEKRYHKLKIENDRLINQLNLERTKCGIYQKKLKFIQDNQKNFEKLKEVYLSMKNKESKDGETISVELQEQASQTMHFDTESDIKNIKMTLSKLVDTCDKDSLTTYHGNVIQTESMVSIKRSELSDAQENLQLLKEMIRKREYTWSVNVQREEALRDEIKDLEHDKQSLQASVKVKELELKALKNMNSENPNEQQDTINNMKRIIGKMSKRLREVESVHAGKATQNTLIFNEKEKDMVQQIEKKVTISKKPASKTAIHHATKTGPNRNPPATCSAKPIRNIRQGPLSPIIEAKSKSVMESSEEYDSDVQELELLGQIKKSIEAKQAALKEKVQQIINYSEQKKEVSK